MKTAKLKDFYTEQENKLGLSTSMIDGPILKAVSNKVEELEVTPEEFMCVMQFAIANNVYYQAGRNDHEVMGIKLKILDKKD